MKKITYSEFLQCCEQLIQNGWKARVEPGGKGIQLRKPNGRKFCFSVFAAIYSEQRGQVCRNSYKAAKHVHIEDQANLYTADVWCATDGAVSDEGRVEIFRRVYSDLLLFLGIQIEG